MLRKPGPGVGERNTAGEMYGKCVFTYADGAKYDGEYKDDKMDGKGVFACASGRSQQSEWEDMESIKTIRCMARGCLPVLVAEASKASGKTWREWASRTGCRHTFKV